MFGQAMTISPAKRRILIALVFLAGNLSQLDPARGDLQIAGYQDRLHDRFYAGADKAFIGADYNWSGNGRMADPVGDGTNWKQVVMISENYFITANHNHPNLGDDPAGAPPSVRFYRSNDPNGEFWEAPIAAAGSEYVGSQIGATDLWVGKLASTPPSWVTRYPLAKRHEATNYLSYMDRSLFILGQDSPRSLSSVRLGRNAIDSVNSAGEFIWSYDPENGFGESEAQTMSGDSGGASFYLSGKMPVLAGIHSRSNLDTGVSMYIDEITAAVGEPVSVSTGLTGDLNGDFRVNSADFFRLFAKFTTRSSGSFGQGDLNGDGIVDLPDLTLLSANYNRLLFAPADSDDDGDVDSIDLAQIGANWLKSVEAPYEAGDANGDAHVNLFDLMAFDASQNRAYFGPLPSPLIRITGDLDGNGIVNDIDSNIVSANLNRRVTPGTYGDLNFNGVVDFADLSTVTSALGDLFGDINGDHQVGPADFVVLASNWNRAVSGGRLTGDMNGDGRVNALDAKALFDWWGVTSSGAFGGISIPEPASGLLVLVAILFAASNRRLRSRGR
jgi:hypothetical protein